MKEKGPRHFLIVSINKLILFARNKSGPGQGWKKKRFFSIKPGFYWVLWVFRVVWVFREGKKSKSFIWKFKDGILLVMFPYDDNSSHFII